MLHLKKAINQDASYIPVCYRAYWYLTVETLKNADKSKLHLVHMKEQKLGSGQSVRQNKKILAFCRIYDNILKCSRKATNTCGRGGMADAHV